jgi:hypothetical protein
MAPLILYPQHYMGVSGQPHPGPLLQGKEAPLPIGKLDGPPKSQLESRKFTIFLSSPYQENINFCFS